MQSGEQEPRETPWPGGFGLQTRHTPVRGDAPDCSAEGEASAMFAVMFPGMLRGFKHIKRIYRNTDIGNAVGRSRRIPENTHARDCNMTPGKRNKKK